MRWDICIDLGTQNMRMLEGKNGASFDEAAAVAYGADGPVRYGDAAWQLFGRQSPDTDVAFPLTDGTLSRADRARELLAWAYSRSHAVNLSRRFSVLLTAAPFSRPVQMSALMDAAADAGATDAALIRTDVACALGAGVDIRSPQASLVVDIGAGKMTATLFTMNRIASFAGLPYGLDRVDQRIRRNIQLEDGFSVGPHTVRDIKHTLITAQGDHAPQVEMKAAGVNMRTRLPEVFSVAPARVHGAAQWLFEDIVSMCLAVTGSAPEELCADLNDTGVIVCGGGALIPGLDKLLGDSLGIPCRIAPAPANCAIRGLEIIMQRPDDHPVAFINRMTRTAWR